MIRTTTTVEVPYDPDELVKLDRTRDAHVVERYRDAKTRNTVHAGASGRIVRRRLLAAAALLLLAGPLDASVAFAHTAPVPLEIDPPPGSELDEVPGAIVLKFDGAFTDNVSVSLLNSTGAVVPSTTQVDDSTVTLQPTDPRALPDDTYRIAWEVQTAHSADAPDGVGAESRQVHFYVGVASAGRLLKTDVAADEQNGSSTATTVVLGSVVAAAAALAAVSVKRSKARALGAAAFALLGGMVLVWRLADDPRRGSAERELPQGQLAAVVEDGTLVTLEKGPEWVVQTTDEHGDPTLWATSAQLRFVDPDDGQSEVVDLLIDSDALGRLRTDIDPALVDWDAELVLSTFNGPVYNFRVP